MTNKMKNSFYSLKSIQNHLKKSIIINHLKKIHREKNLYTFKKELDSFLVLTIIKSSTR